MTEPAAGPPILGSQTPGSAPITPDMPDEAAMMAEIDTDRRHERFLLRAALVAAIVVALALSARLLWA